MDDYRNAQAKLQKGMEAQKKLIESLEFSYNK